MTREVADYSKEVRAAQSVFADWFKSNVQLRLLEVESFARKFFGSVGCWATINISRFMPMSAPGREERREVKVGASTCKGKFVQEGTSF